MTTAPRHLFSRLFRLLVTLSALLSFAGLVACGGSAAPTSDNSSDPTSDPIPDPATEPPPGDAPERAVEVVEYGSGDTTVVFESGLGNGWSPWKMVATEVAKQARTFAYSRPGYGGSEPSPEPRDAAHIVEDLRDLLANRGYAPPYVLVGHSFGGTYMELFAKAHPEEVLGLVLVESRHRDFTTACEDAGFEGCSIPPSVIATLPQVQIDEFEAFSLASDQIRAAGGFGTYPVRVLTATSHGFAPEVEALWESMLGSLADEAADGEQAIYPGAGHLLQLQRAEEVAEVISSLIPAPEG